MQDVIGANQLHCTISFYLNSSVGVNLSANEEQLADVYDTGVDGTNEKTVCTYCPKLRR